MNNRQSKILAVFLTAVMLVGFTAAFAGTAAATVSESDSSIQSNPADKTATAATHTVVIDGDLSSINFADSTDDKIILDYKGEEGNLDVGNTDADVTVTGIDGSNSQQIFQSTGTVTTTDGGGDHQLEVNDFGASADLSSSDVLRVTIDNVDHSVGSALSDSVSVEATVEGGTAGSLGPSSIGTLDLGSQAPISVDDGAGTNYYSLSDAVSDANSQATVTVDGDVNEFTAQPAPLGFSTEYALNPINVDKELTVTGNGATVTSASDGGDGSGTVMTINNNDATVEGLSFDGQVSAANGAQADQAIESSTHSGVTVQDNTFNNFASGNPTLDFTVNGDLTVHNNTIPTTNANGIVVDASSATSTDNVIDLTSNDITVDGTTGITISDLSVEPTLNIADTNIAGGSANSGTGLVFTASDQSATINVNNVTTFNVDQSIDVVTGSTGDISVNKLNATNVAGSDVIQLSGETDASTADGDFTLQNSLITDVTDQRALRIGESNAYAGAITVSNTTIDGTGTGAAIQVEGSDLAGDLTINQGTVLNDTSEGLTTGGTDNAITGSLTVDDVTISNTSNQAGLVEVSGDFISINNLSLDQTGVFDTSETSQSDLDSLSVQNVDATGISDAVLNLQHNNNANTVNVDTVNVTNVSGTSNSLISVQGTSGFETETVIQNVDILNYTGSADDLIDVSGLTSGTIDTVSVDNISIEKVNSGNTDSGINLNTDATTTSVSNVVLVDASGLTAVDVQKTDAGRSDTVLNVSNVDVQNVSTGINLNDGGNLDGATIEDTVMTDVRSFGINAQAFSSGNLKASNLTVQDVNTTTAGGIVKGVTIATNSIDTVEIDQSSFNNFQGDNSHDAFGIEVRQNVNLNVTNSAFTDVTNTSIRKVNSGGGSGDLVATFNTFDNVDTAIDDSGENFNSANATRNWWGDATGPNGADNDISHPGAGANVNLNSGSSSVEPWFDSPALDAFAFGIEGTVFEPDGSSTNYAPADVSISYQGQTSDIDDSTTFTVSASGEYVAVIDEHDGSEFYTASANTPGFAESDAQEDITISGTTFFASQDFTLNDGASLEGFVNNASGEQLQSTGNLQLIDASNDEVLVDGFSTNASGGFTVSLTPDTYDLRVNHPNFDSSNTVEGVELQSGNTTTLATNFTLREGTTADFTATVEFSNGTAIENTDVTFSGSGGVPSSNDASLPVTQTTNSSGIVQFEIPASDTNDAYTITADSANFSNASTGVATAPGDSVSRTFSLEADQQEPSVSVNFTDQTVPNGTEQVTVDSAEFTQADGSAGDYVVVVHTIDEFGAPVGEVSNPIGASGDLTGAEEDITVDLTAADGPIDSITEDVTLRAMLHTTDNNSAFGTRLGSGDAAIDGIERGDETDDANITISEDIFVEPAPGTGADSPPQDPNGDGTFEDVNGDNATNFDDVVALAFVLSEKNDLTQQQRDAFDIDDNGVVNFDDVVRLAFPN